jgi:hypothetical protein
VGRISLIRCVETRERSESIPRSGGRLPARIQLSKVAISLLEPIDRGLAALACRRQAEKQAEQFIGASPVRAPAKLIVDELAEDLTLVAYDSDLLDASALLIPQVGFLPPEDARVQGTVAAIERKLVRGGLVLRYDRTFVLGGP